jgi:predicted nucleotidyltransferase
MVIAEAEIVSEIVRRVVAEFDPEQNFLFGSRAWGQPGSDSDYDLMVVVSESHERPERRAFRAQRCLSRLGIAKDVIVMTVQEFDRASAVPASLESEILLRGKVLFGCHPREVRPDIERSDASKAGVANE